MKDLNWRLRPSMIYAKYPMGFQISFFRCGLYHMWGGRTEDADWVVTEADYPHWAPSESDESAAPDGRTLEPERRQSHHIET